MSRTRDYSKDAAILSMRARGWSAPRIAKEIGCHPNTIYKVSERRTADDYPIRIFVGYDNVEAIAYEVLVRSISARSSRPVMFTPIRRRHLRHVFTRQRGEYESTDFSISRFLTPFLAGFKGWALFMDCDMLCLEDIDLLWNLRNQNYAVQVVKHDHKPNEERKFLGQPQTRYEKKNWSSLMLMNCARCMKLTPEYVNEASGLDLHQFKWLPEEEIGELPGEWNHLVDYDNSTQAPAIVHFTEGGPWFPEYRNVQFADTWRAEMAAVA